MNISVSSGTTTRPYTDADAGAVAHLLTLADAQYGAEPGFTESAVRSVIDTIAVDQVRDTLLVFAPPAEGTLIAIGAVGTPPVGGKRSSTFGGVHPDWQRRGLGRELLTWQLERAREIHAERAPHEEWIFDAGCNLLDERGARLFKSFGMEPVRYFFDMVADPATAPEVAVPDGLRVATYTPDLAHALYEAHMEAFSDHWGYQRRPFEAFETMAIGSTDFRADLCRIAFDGDEIAGYVLAYDGAEGCHYIGQVGTRRPWRRRGLAGALVARSMRAAAESGRTMSMLGVDADSPTGAVSVYERVGFATHARFVAYHSTIPPLNDPARHDPARHDPDRHDPDRHGLT